MARGPDIILYHSVQSDNRFPASAGVNLPPEIFERHLSYLAATYTVVPLEHVLSPLPRSGPGRLAISFDDGYGDTGEIAYPLLKRFSLPATFFLTVGQMGKNWPFPRGLYPGLSWERAREMGEDPRVGFGSHGLSHHDLTRLPIDEVAHEIGESKKILEEQLSRRVEFFSYPHGSYNPEVKNLVRRTAYRAAFAVIPHREDDFSRRRILVSRRDNLFRLRLKLSPLYWPLRKII
jgi:peptidoglycan/xylan/chitin deacetylase (PgdA/CDA1 family)